MSIVINGVTVNNLDNVKFSTINNFDPILWTGEVEGDVSFEMAKLIYPDILRIHGEVIQSLAGANIPAGTPLADIEDQQFIVLNTNDGPNANTRIAFATEWIINLQVVTEVNNVDVRVFGLATGDIAAMLQVLTENGYNAKIL